MNGTQETTGQLSVSDATIGYGKRVISSGLTTSIPEGSFTVILGPNACGKSTLLKAMSRVLEPTAGLITLDGKELKNYRAKDLARRLGLLPQTATAPDGITVSDLISRGRHPYHTPLKQWSTADEAAIVDAMASTQVADLASRQVDELSGGQRQRVWIALLLAQQTPLMLLDEPTTYLDIAHQYEVLELLRGLNGAGKTVVAVLHDLNQAARYASHVIVMKHGEIVAVGDPSEVITADLVEDVYGLPCVVVPDPVTGTPAVFPREPRS